MHFMYSKWGDAFSQIFAFASVTVDRAAEKATKEDSAKVQRVEATLEKLAHNFTLLSAIAADRLAHGDTQRMEMRAHMRTAWRSQIVKREQLQVEDLTGARTLP